MHLYHTGKLMKNIGVIVAHPDDEIIGVGGTIIKNVKQNNNIKILILSEGVTSRLDRYNTYESKELFKTYGKETIEALEVMGVDKNSVNICKLPNNRLDQVDLLDIVKIIENFIKNNQIDTIYTHFYQDLNIDHEIVSRATVTAARSLPFYSVKELYFFETLSSTEYGLAMNRVFIPTLFEDISEVLEIKLKAMGCYISELRKKPHPRNLETIKMNAMLWGNKVGIEAAEAFQVGRIIK